MQRSLAIVLSLAGCAESEPPLCSVESGTVMVFEDGYVCAVTPTGLVLHSEGSQLVLERLTEAGSLEELTRIEVTAAWPCGTVAEDPESETIWLTIPGDEQPDRLVRLDAEGQQLGEEELLHEGAPIHIASSLVRAGELYLAGSVPVADPANAFDPTALLERRDVDGALVWRQIGYAGFNPLGDVVGHDFAGLGSIVGLTGGLAVFGGTAGIDSSSISMLSIRAVTGDVIWADAVTPDDYDGPYARLGSDGDRTIFVSEERKRRYDYSQSTSNPPLLRVALSIVTSHSSNGWTNWRGEVEWPELEDIRVTEAVSEAASVVHVVSGSDVDDRDVRHVSLARQDWIGVLDCKASLDHLGLWSATSLHQLDDGRLVIAGTVVDSEQEPEFPTAPPRLPAIVLIHPR